MKLLAITVVLLAGCSKQKSSSQPTNSPPPLAEGEQVVDSCAHKEKGQHPIEARDEPAKIVRGNALPSDVTAVSLKEVVANPDSYVGKKHVISGLVRAACTKKGCWMELADYGGDGQGARVVFQDYSFFVPKDSKGSKAELYGEVQMTRVTKEQVEHYQAEGASFSKIYSDGSAREIRIIAEGVELTR